MIATQPATSKEDSTTMSPRGGKRDPSPGKTIGRPKGTVKDESEKRKSIAISLNQNELDTLDELCIKEGLTHLADGKPRATRSDFVQTALQEWMQFDTIAGQYGLNRSDFVRLAMRYAGVLAALKQES